MRRAAIPIAAVVLIAAAAFAQRPFRQFSGVEYERFQLPADWNEKTEFVFATLGVLRWTESGHRSTTASASRRWLAFLLMRWPV